MAEFAERSTTPQLVLDATQQQVLDALRRKEQPKLPLGDWYLGALWALTQVNNPDRFAQAAHSLRELMEKFPRVFTGAIARQAPQFRQRRSEIRTGLIAADKAYPKCTWLQQPMSAGLAKTLDQTVDYLELSLTYSRSAQIVEAITALDPLFTAPSQVAAAVKAKQFQKLWDSLEEITHHGSKPVAMIALLKELEDMILTLVEPVVTEDQAEIAKLLKEGPTPANAERMLKLIGRRGANYLLFFQKVNDAAWLDSLVAAGQYAQPPKAVPSANGGVTYEYWWPMAPLQRMVGQAEEKVVSLVEKLPETDNPRVLQEILAVAVAAPTVAQSLRLRELALRYINLPAVWLAFDLCGKLIKKWSIPDNDAAIQAGLKLATALLNLRDPGKQAERRFSCTRFLPPREMWEYREIAEKGLQPLIEVSPLDVAGMLAAKLRRVFKSEAEGTQVPWEDGSHWWCTDLVNADPQESDPRCVLAVALTRAALAAVTKDLKAFGEVRNLLRKQPRELFDRILWTLYVQHPEASREEIAAEITGGRQYGVEQYSFEFHQLVVHAFSRFGVDFLSESERQAIFSKIRSGPDKAAYVEFQGEEAAARHWEGASRRFHLFQLAPFTPGLFGDYRTYYDELVRQFGKPPSGPEYIQGGGGRSGVVQQQSPKSTGDLAALSDADLIAYLNEWNESRRNEADFLIEISFRGLAGAFAALIEKAPARFAVWDGEWTKLLRPIYIAAAIETGGKLIKEGKTEQVETWLRLCTLAAMQTAIAHDQGHEGSAEKPNWNSARRATVDFIEIATNPKHPVDLTWTSMIWSLITALASGADPDLESDATAKREAYSTAINRTRSRALQVAVGCADWAKDQAPLHELMTQRFAGKPPLTLPERTLLAVKFPHLYFQDAEWTKAHVAAIFPRDDFSLWVEIFGAYLLFTQPYIPLFPLLEGEFAHALADVKAFRAGRFDRDRAMMDHLGSHVFTYFAHGLSAASGEKSHLRQFLEQVSTAERGHLFHHVGALLSGTNDLPVKIWGRVQVYFKERLKKRDSEELSHFSLWLKAKCLPAKWRLESYSTLLDQPGGKEISVFSEVEALAELRNEEPVLVMECFAKVTALMPKIQHFYIDETHAKALLKEGLANNDAVVQKSAKAALENLLANGQSGYMDLGGSP